MGTWHARALVVGYPLFTRPAKWPKRDAMTYDKSELLKKIQDRSTSRAWCCARDLLAGRTTHAMRKAEEHVHYEELWSWAFGWL